MKISNLSKLTLAVLILNVIIYFRAEATILDSELVFAECARNSGRTSAALNLVILFMLGHYGLKSIFSSTRKKTALITLSALFTVNHLIHFFFVFQNFKVQANELSIIDNLHGFVTFLLIIIAPLIIYKVNGLGKLLYAGIVVHFFNVTYMIGDTFYARYKPIDPAYLHRIGIVIMIVSLLYILYRSYKEWSISYH